MPSIMVETIIFPTKVGVVTESKLGNELFWISVYARVPAVSNNNYLPGLGIYKRKKKESNKTRKLAKKKVKSFF